MVLGGSSPFAIGQTLISGKVTNQQGEGLPGASVYLENTLDGASSDEEGVFSFITHEEGAQVLVVSSIGYQTIQQTLSVSGEELTFNFQLKEAYSNLNEVVVTAGTFEASNDGKVAVLSPMDIVSTAGAAGDIMGAIRALPGTQPVGEQTGLFVRGGEAYETSVVIDGLTVQNPFQSDVPGVSQRSRFSPFQFKGVSFSSGGYSARYGQALSSVLELNTLDLPEETTLSTDLSFGGISLSGAQRWENSGFEATANYTNLAPFFKLADTNFNFYDIPKGADASARYTSKVGENGFFKAFAQYSWNTSGTETPNPYAPGDKIRFGLENQYGYFNTSYRYVKDQWTVFTATSASINDEQLDFGETPGENQEWRLQWRGETGYYANEQFNVLLGAEVQRYQEKRGFDTLAHQYDETLTAVYAEAEWTPAPKFAVKPGIRYEYSNLLNKHSLAPRLSLAYKTGTYSQVSMAGGLFYQNPDTRYLLPGHRPDLSRAVHYIANYQWRKDDRIFRIEGYHKSYDQLIREREVAYDPNPYRFVYGKVDNTGEGYARGIDVFWRDKASVPFLDYWVSYSFIDAERLYANFPEKATPDFVADHTLNLVTKYLIEAIGVNVGLGYTYATGRPYYNPNETDFLSSRAPDYHNLSLTLSYLTQLDRWFMVAYVGADNILNHKNVFGYRYNAEGTERFPIEPALYRSVFAGIAISLSEFTQDDL